MKRLKLQPPMLPWKPDPVLCSQPPFFPTEPNPNLPPVKLPYNVLAPSFFYANKGNTALFRLSQLKWGVVVDSNVAYEISPNQEPKKLPEGFWKGEVISYQLLFTFAF